MYLNNLILSPTEGESPMIHVGEWDLTSKQILWLVSSLVPSVESVLEGLKDSHPKAVPAGLLFPISTMTVPSLYSESSCLHVEGVRWGQDPGCSLLESGRGAERPATESAGRLGMFILKILWAEEPGRLPSTGLQESDTTKQLNHHHKSQEKI